MLGDLPEEILGSSPKYPPINNLDYLSVDIANYDNYPSDNNPVRIQPKLADLWNTKKENTGINLVPNQGTSLPMGMRNAEENPEVVNGVVREAKKAMMSGLKETELANHLRARFSSEELITAKEAMKKLSEEQGLLGNVYIDASAFSDAKEAESFLVTHRSRLAQDIVLNEGKVSPNVIGYLANKFHKNVVADISYNENLFKKYKAHLVNAGKIANDFVIDSKEALRKAFLSKAAQQPKVVTASSKKKLSKEVAVKELIHRAENNQTAKQAVKDDFIFRRIFPILEFARENISKGKTGGALKEMLRGKYASVDLNDAARYLAVVLSNRVTADSIDKLVERGRVSKMIGNDLKKLANEYPLKIERYQETKSERQVGVPAHFHVLSGKKESSKLTEYVKEAVDSLQKGHALEQVKDELLGKKLSNGDAESVLMSAVQDFNEVSAGVKANSFKPQPKKKVVADLPEPKTLPDPKTILPETQEYIDFFANASFDIDIDDAPDTSLLEIGGLDHKSGLDGAF